MKELYVDGNLAEDRAVLRDELQSVCEEVSDDAEETAEKHEGMIMKFKTIGVSQRMGKLLKCQLT